MPASGIAGRQNRQIAADLEVSEITVKVHRANAMRKLRAKSVPELVRMADLAGMASPSMTADLQLGLEAAQLSMDNGRSNQIRA